jgi:hypothetical protein
MSWGPEEFETMNKIVADANKSIEGRVLSEEDLKIVEKQMPLCVTKGLAYDLLATIRDRDKTIAELEQSHSKMFIKFECEYQANIQIREQNAILLSALGEVDRHTREDDPTTAMRKVAIANKIVSDAIAKSKGMEGEQG